MKNLKKSLSKKQEMCVELLAAGCYSQKQIAEALNVDESTISCWKKREDFKDAYTKALWDNIRDIASEAVSTERKLLKARSEMVRLMTAKDILDRAGIKDGKLPFNVAADDTEDDPLTAAIKEEIKKRAGTE